MKVLLACEESQIVTKEFRRLGHEAFSNDIIDCSGGRPEWHIKADVLNIIDDNWDMIIAFPPCTFLTVTGNRWFNVERYGEKAVERHKEREKAINFFLAIANAKCPKIAIENPVGIMSSHWKKPDQIINPFEFGEPFQKQTCLWLKRLPLLKPTNIVQPPPRVFYKSGKSMPKWYSDLVSLPKDERSKQRSKTFKGIARAMALQWG